MKRFMVLVVVMIIVSVLATACDVNDKKVVIYTSVDRVYSEPIFKLFEENTGIKVLPVYDVEAAKTTGLVQRLISEKGNPQADIFWNGEILYTIKLKNEGLLESYRSVKAEGIPENFIDNEGMWTAFGGRARVFIMNKKSRGIDSVELTFDNLEELSKDYNVGLAKPMFGTTATHIAALYAVLGEKEGYELLETIKNSRVAIVDGNGAVRDMVVSGQLDLGLTDTDDAIGAVQKGANVDLAFPDQGENGIGTLVIPNTVALIKGSKHSENAKQFIDFLLDEQTIAQLIEAGWFQLSVGETVVVDKVLEPYLPESKQLKVLDISFKEIAEVLTQSAEDMNHLFLD